MTADIAITLGITLAAVVLFATEKIRMDAVAVLVLCALLATGQINLEEALSGFSNPATITVAAMFVLAAGLQQSGALNGIGTILGKVKSRLMFLLVLFAATALVSPFVNNTAVVAVFIPIVMAAAANIKMPASKALIPLSYVSQMAGVCTLIGTSTNLLVNAIAQEQGHAGFGMFGFAPLGLIFLAVGCLYLLIAGRWLLPEAAADQNAGTYQGRYVAELRVPSESPLIGQTADGAALREESKLYVLALLRNGQKLSTPGMQSIQADDVLLVHGEPEQLIDLRNKFDLRHYTLSSRRKDADDADWLVSEVMVAPNSKWIGGNIRLLSQHWNRNLTVLGVQRRSRTVRERLNSVSFRVGDILLMALPKDDAEMLRRDKNFILLSENHARKAAGWRAPFALFAMTAAVAAAAFGWLPIAASAMLAAVAMIAARCLSAEDTYRVIDWRIIILLAGLLPLGAAMANSGAAQFIVDHTLGRVSSFGPFVVLAVLYLVTMILTEFMSNAGTAVLMTPIAISTANMLGVDASPFLVAVIFAAATSFMTPVGYQTNTMVYGAGGYKFTDFIKIGLPLNLLYWLLGIWLIPMIWPFEA